MNQRLATWRLPASAVLASAAVAFWLFAAWALVHYGAYTRDFGWISSESQVTYVDPAGPAASFIQPGDRILTINGSPFLVTLPPAIAIRAISADGRYDVRMRRSFPGLQPQEQTVHLHVTQHRDWYLTWRQSPFLFGALVSFLVSLILLKRSANPVARLFFLVLVCFGVRQTLLVLHPFYNQLSPGGQWFVLAAWAPEPFYLLIAMVFHAMYRFPPSVPKGRVWSALQIGFYLAYVGFAARAILLGRAELPLSNTNIYFYPGRAVYGPLENGLRNELTLLFGVSALLALCAVVARNYRLITQVSEHRRMRWILFGFLAAFAPYCVVLLVQVIGDTVGIAMLQRGLHSPLLLWALNGWLAIVPICFGYAVARHRLFDIRLIVRRGLQYLLARRMLQTLIVLPAAAFSISIALNPSRTLTQLLFEGSGFFNLALLAATAASLRFRQQLLTSLDRRFFRQAYDRESILIALPEKLRALRSPAQVAAKVAADVSEALYPRGVYFLSFDRSAQRFSTLFSSDGAPVTVTEGEPVWHRSSCAVSELGSSSEAESLSNRGVSWVVPLLGDGHLTGLLLLSEKRSEEPYSSRDRELLEAIAAQTAMQLEKMRLEDELRREREQVKQMAVRLGEDTVNYCRECPRCGTCYDGDVTTCPKDGAEPVVVRPIDRTIHGRYRLDRLIGQGGMGAVYQATDLRLKREVAVKIMLSELFGNDKALQRFQREAEVSARLQHANIVRVYDFGAFGSSGAYLVMEYLTGITMRRALIRDGRQNPTDVARWMDALLSGMESAHAAGVVHRDLKPENLLLVPIGEGEDQVKILDFGLAKVKLLHLADADQLTVPGVTMGTLGYMPPEQVAGSEVDHRADIYAIGTILAELLTGKMPSLEDDLDQLLAENLEGDTARLASIIHTARATSRSERYNTATELRGALADAMAHIRPRAFVIDRAMLFQRLGVEPTSNAV